MVSFTLFLLLLLGNSSTTFIPQEEFLMGNDSIDPDLYDISKLYPKFGNIEDYRGWLLASKITTSTVGLLARFWMRSKQQCLS